jgi:histidinol-phosphatase
VDADLALALELADAADAITVAGFRSRDLRVDTKPDLSPVTEADRAAERALRERLAQARPDDAFLGEETGERGGDGGSGRRWIVDPVDGTRNFSRGVPVWATLVALERDGSVAVGVVSAPALGRRWWAVRGDGAFADGERIRVSRVARLDEAAVSVPAARGFPARAWHVRDFGDFWQHVLVAEGSLDACVDPRLDLWDTAAVSVVVEEAGGRFTDLAGTDGPYGGAGISSNGLLHEELLATLATSRA